jgi:hypothetical protein
MFRRWFLIGAWLIALALPVGSQAGWSNYFGTATFYRTTSTDSGWNYWTNNRVYRPTGHPFYLAYENTSLHYSATNTDTNPITFASYGYNHSYCAWNWLAWSDPATSVSNVTCQVYI